jgi:hypothetical protein
MPSIDGTAATSDLAAALTFELDVEPMFIPAIAPELAEPLDEDVELELGWFLSAAAQPATMIPLASSARPRLLRRARLPLAALT